MSTKFKDKILVLTYWSFSDALIQAYTLPYIQILSINYNITLFCIDQKQTRFMHFTKTEHNLNQHNSSSIDVISAKYYKNKLLMAVAWMLYIPILFFFIIFKKISFIHCWCTPAATFGNILSIFTSKPLVIDSFEPHADAMVENGTWKKTSLIYRLLKFSEKWQSARAGILFACTPNMNDYIIKNFRNDLSSKIIYKPACVDLNNFDYTRYDLAKIKLKYYKCDDIVCVYAGKFGGIYLEDEIFHFISLAYKFWCNKFKFLLLSNASSDYIVSKCNLHRIPYEIIDQFFVPHDQMPLYLARADFALSPIMQVPSKKFCSPIKNSEYFAMGLPILISDGISIDSDIIKKKSFGYVMPEWNSEYILKAIMYFDSYLNLSNKDKIRESIRNLAIRERSFLLARKAYSKYYKIEP